MTEKGKNKGKEKLNNNNNNPNIKPKNETNNQLEQNIIKTAQNEIIEKNIRKTSSIKIELDKEKESMAKLEVLDEAYNFNEEEFNSEFSFRQMNEKNSKIVQNSSLFKSSFAVLSTSALSGLLGYAFLTTGTAAASILTAPVLAPAAAGAVLGYALFG